MLFSSIPPHQENQKQYHDRAYTLTTATIRYDCVYYILLTCLYAVECFVTRVPVHEDTTLQTFDASFCWSLILVGELWKRVPWFFSTIPPPFFYSRTLRVYVFSNAWSRDSEHTSCKHSVCHALYPSPWRGNCEKESRDSFPQFPHQLLAFSTYTSQQVHPHVSDRGLNYIRNIR